MNFIEFLFSCIDVYIHSFMGKIKPIKMTSLPICGAIAQLVERSTSIAGPFRGHGFESR